MGGALVMSLQKPAAQAAQPDATAKQWAAEMVAGRLVERNRALVVALAVTLAGWAATLLIALTR